MKENLKTSTTRRFIVLLFQSNTSDRDQLWLKNVENVKREVFKESLAIVMMKRNVFEFYDVSF